MRTGTALRDQRRCNHRLYADVLILLICLVMLAACTKEESVSRNAEIAMGDYTLRLASVEARASGDESRIILYLKTTGVNSTDDAARFIKRFAKNMRLRDGAGKKYRLTGLEPADLLRAETAANNQDMDNVMEAAERMHLGRFNEWVAIFSPPLASSDFVLLLENPDPHRGQPKLVGIPVGR